MGTRHRSSGATLLYRRGTIIRTPTILNWSWSEEALDFRMWLCFARDGFTTLGRGNDPPTNCLRDVAFTMGVDGGAHRPPAFDLVFLHVEPGGVNPFAVSCSQQTSSSLSARDIHSQHRSPTPLHFYGEGGIYVVLSRMALQSIRTIPSPLNEPTKGPLPLGSSFTSQTIQDYYH